MLQDSGAFKHSANVQQFSFFQDNQEIKSSTVLTNENCHCENILLHTCQSPAASHQSRGSSVHRLLQMSTVKNPPTLTGFTAVFRFVPSSWSSSEESGIRSAGSAFCSSARVLSIFPCKDSRAALGLKRRLVLIMHVHKGNAVPHQWRRARAPLWQQGPSLQDWMCSQRRLLWGGNWFSSAEIDAISSRSDSKVKGTHFWLSIQISCDKVGGEKSNSSVVLSFPPVWITVWLINTPRIKNINRRTQENLFKLNYMYSLVFFAFKQTLPVIQNQNNFSCFESQFVIFSRLKVVQRADLSDLLHCTTTAVALGVRVQGPSLRL